MYMNNNCAAEVVQERDFITTKKYNCYMLCLLSVI